MLQMGKQKLLQRYLGTIHKLLAQIGLRKIISVGTVLKDVTWTHNKGNLDKIIKVLHTAFALVDPKSVKIH